MSGAEPIVAVSDENLGKITGSRLAVLILARSNCGHCAAYQDDIRQLAGQHKLDGIAIGKIVLDLPGSARFKRENGWLRDLHALPYTLLYRDGVRVDEFAASKGSYLMERLEAILQSG